MHAQEFKDAHVRKLNKTFALVLPFVQPLLPGEEKHEEVRRVTFDAVRSMARQVENIGYDCRFTHMASRACATVICSGGMLASASMLAAK